MAEKDNTQGQPQDEPPPTEIVRPWNVKKTSIADHLKRRQKEIYGFDEDFIAELDKV